MGKIFKALEKSEASFKKESGEKKETKPGDEVNLNLIEEPLKKKPGIKNENNYANEKAKSNPKLITVHDPHSVEAEQFRLLKNSILFPDSGKPRKTIMVTSTDQAEGKSFVASNLAASIAMSIDEYVLIIDSDLRNPSVHSMFGIKNRFGLSEYLSNKMDLEDLLVKSFLKKLTILPGGPPPLNPSELVSSEQMKDLVREVKARYDDRYIIIDTPPPYLTSETNALATYVDGIIMVVKQGRTDKKRLQDIIGVYGKDKIIGVVKNYATGKFGLGYGYKYRYAYGKKG